MVKIVRVHDTSVLLARKPVKKGTLGKNDEEVSKKLLRTPEAGWKSGSETTPTT